MVVGRARIMPESRKNPKPEKYSKMRQNPHHPLHALLAGVFIVTAFAVKEFHIQNFIHDNYAVFLEKEITTFQAHMLFIHRYSFLMY